MDCKHKFGKKSSMCLECGNSMGYILHDTERKLEASMSRIKSLEDAITAHMDAVIADDDGTLGAAANERFIELMPEWGLYDKDELYDEDEL